VVLIWSFIFHGWLDIEMSRAFVKESDEQSAADGMPERPVSGHPNYVTPRGLEQLHTRMQELQREHARLVAQDDPLARQKKLEIERDLRYYNAQIERTIMVNPATQPRDEVRFGATVEIRGENGARHTFHIVGDDEADIACGHISWAAPLATALIGAKVGDRVTWQRPAGPLEVEILAIRYSPQDGDYDTARRRV
jgi:transcription elongation factor GreB